MKLKARTLKMSLHLLTVAGIIALAVFVGVQLSDSGSASDTPADTITFETRGTPDPGSEGTLSMADEQFKTTPRALTGAECANARPRMEAQVVLWQERIKTLPDTKSLENHLTAASTDSREWFDAGCPAHEKLGYYDAVDGSGTIKSVLLDFP